jgi:polyisoprenoid-binding protein YceI
MIQWMYRRLSSLRKTRSKAAPAANRPFAGDVSRRLDSLRKTLSKAAPAANRHFAGDVSRRLDSLRKTRSTDATATNRPASDVSRRLDSLRYFGAIAAAGLFLCVSTAASATKLTPQNAEKRIFKIDSSQSRIAAILSQEGLMARRYRHHRVEVKSFTGRIEVSSEDIAENAAQVEIEAESKSLTNVDKEMSEFERSEFHGILNGTVLESAKFPSIRFVSLSVSGVKRSGANRSFTLNGDLTLHGVTKRISFPVSVAMTGETLRATGEASLKQTDFGMTPYSGGLGLIKIGDDVKVDFVIVAKSL